MNGVTYKPSNVGANDPFDAPAPGTPYENAAPAGTATFASVFGTGGAALNGTWSLYGDDDAGSDPGRMDGGWTLIFESDSYACSVGPVVGEESRADFDGDGCSDLSVFRPSEGNWYLQQSTNGFTAFNLGIASDTLIPGDYDGDGTDDQAVYRNGTWYLNQSTNGFFAAPFGLASDSPIPAAYIP